MSIRFGSAQQAPCAPGDTACEQLQALQLHATHALPQFRLGGGWVLNHQSLRPGLRAGISAATSDTQIGRLDALSVDIFLAEGAPTQIRFELLDSRAAFWCWDRRARRVRAPIVGPLTFRCSPGTGHALSLTVLRGLVTPNGDQVLMRWVELGEVLDILRHGLADAHLTRQLWATASVGVETDLPQGRTQLRGRLGMHAMLRLPEHGLQLGADFWVRPLMWSSQESREQDSRVTAGARAEVGRYWRMATWSALVGVEAQGQWGNSAFLALDNPTGSSAPGVYVGAVFRLQRAFTNY